MRIICDMDEVIVDMMNPLLKRYNEKYNSDITIEDITQWGLPQDMKDIYMKEYFFEYLPTIKGAIKGAEQLMAWGHDVVIATNHSGDGYIANQKVSWMKGMMPGSFANMMIGARKDLLQGDVIIDDNADYLINSPCPIKICMDRPWNRMENMVKICFDDYNSDNPKIRTNPMNRLYRVYDWQEILSLFAGGVFKVW